MCGGSTDHTHAPAKAVKAPAKKKVVEKRKRVVKGKVSRRKAA